MSSAQQAVTHSEDERECETAQRWRKCEHKSTLGLAEHLWWLWAMDVVGEETGRASTSLSRFHCYYTHSKHATMPNKLYVDVFAAGHRR